MIPQVNVLASMTVFGTSFIWLNDNQSLDVLSYSMGYILFGLYLLKINGFFKIIFKSLQHDLFTLTLTHIELMILIGLASFIYDINASFFIKTVFLQYAIMTLLTVSRWKLFFTKQTILLVGAHHNPFFTFINKNHYRVIAKPQPSEEDIGVSDIVMLLPDNDKNFRLHMMNLCQKLQKPYLAVPTIDDVLGINGPLDQMGDIPLISVTDSYPNTTVKRWLDIVISLCAAILALPLMACSAIAIKLSSPGSIFYTQERSGLHGKPFKIYKFRTMINNAEAKTGPVLAGSKDDRITKVGAFLRASRLDELPQILNVLKGEMSIVGPRPERPYFINEFSKTIPYFKKRLEVKPGITGLAQVFGRYTTNPETKLIYDLLYIQKASFLLDITLIIRTVKVMFSPEYAAGTEIVYEK